MLGETVFVLFSSVLAARDSIVAVFFSHPLSLAGSRRQFSPPLVLMPPRVVVVFFLAVALVMERTL